ncbi:MAG TPA: hypothetical protein VFA82_07465 [Gaiellaceae bacterium]|nr:hypothetical protein [Gaiellaceae bacterium]
MRRLILLTALVAAALLAGVARPAAAATPCWKLLLNDWYDGRIDNTYQLHCYTDALKHLPPDVQTYSSAHDDILRALQSARAKLRASGHKKITPGTLLPAPNTPKAHGGGSTTTNETTPGNTGHGSGGGTGSGTNSGGAGSSGRKSQGGLQGLADKLNPSSPDALPVPLLVLGALAILLVAAGGAGMLVKRLQARREAS